MIRHAVVAVTATATTLAASLGEDTQVYFLSIQPAAANAAVVKFGDVRNLSSTVFGWRLEIPVTSIPSAPWFLDDIRAPALKLSDVGVIGTANDNIMVTWIPRI